MWSPRNQLHGNSPTFNIFSEMEKKHTHTHEKVGKKQKHFKSDVFASVAVGVVDAKAPPY